MGASLRMPRILPRTCFSLFLCVLMLLSLSGCGSSTVKRYELTGVDQGVDLSPITKSDGSPFRIAVMDEGPPIESSELWLRGLCEGLQELGYLPETLDLSAAPNDYEGFYHYVQSAELGEYIAFEPECYFVYGTEEDAELGKRLRQRVEQGQIDAFAVTGTLPGTFLKELDLGIPFLVSFASDPVASGIIDSPENTGNENIWALVETDPVKRQVVAYESLFHMKKLCILASLENPDLGTVDEYQAQAEALGVECSILSIGVKNKENSKFPQWLQKQVQLQLDQGCDAVLVTYDSIDEGQAGILADMLAEQKVPYLIGDAEGMVQEGGLLLMSCYDYENYGRYVAQVLARVFHGQKPGELNCNYTSSLRIVLNLDIAKRTGLLTDYAFLRSVDLIYGG